MAVEADMEGTGIEIIEDLMDHFLGELTSKNSNDIKFIEEFDMYSVFPNQ